MKLGQKGCRGSEKMVGPLGAAGLLDGWNQDTRGREF